MLFDEDDVTYGERTSIAECIQLLLPDQIRYLKLKSQGLPECSECCELEHRLNCGDFESGMGKIHMLGLVEWNSERWFIEPRGKECLVALGFDI